MVRAEIGMAPSGDYDADVEQPTPQSLALVKCESKSQPSAAGAASNNDSDGDECLKPATTGEQQYGFVAKQIKTHSN
jgi:hypothetical protein